MPASESQKGSTGMINKAHLIVFDEPPFTKGGTKVAERWKSIRSGTSVATALKNGATLGDIRFAVAEGRAKLQAASNKGSKR